MVTRPLITRGALPQRYRTRDENAAGTVRFNATGTWNYLSGTGMTATVDPAVTFDGQPTVRIDFTAASTGGYFGLATGKSIAMPADWNGEFCAVVCVGDNYPTPLGTTTGSGNQTNQVGSITSINMYLKNNADTYANSLYKTWNLSGSSTYGSYNGWRTIRWRMNATQNIGDAFSAGRQGTTIGTSNPVGGGIGQPNSFFNNPQLRFIKTAGAACSVWVALMGVPARARPQVLFTFDGGYKGQYDNLFKANMLRSGKYSPLPLSIGVQTDMVANSPTTHFTGANAQEMQASGFVDISVYSKINGGGSTTVGSPTESTAIGQLGLDRYLQNYDIGTAYLQSLGMPRPTFYHPYPQGDYTDALMDALYARGTRIARSANGNGSRTNYSAEVFTGKQCLLMDSTNAIINTDTVAKHTAIMAEEISNGNNIITLCHQVNPAGDYSSVGWAVDRWMALFDWVQDQQRAGLVDTPSMYDFYKGLTSPRRLK